MKMNAVAISQPGGPEVLVPEEVNRPAPAAGEILIRIDAAGVNRPDVLQRAGAYPAPKGASPLPGLEAAGTVEAIGEGAERWSLGDRVCALLPGGGYAEFATCPAGHAMAIPDGVSMTEAAAIPETVLTVWHNVFQRGRLLEGETLLVHGGTSGIGTTAIQLAKARGCRVIATAGSDAKAKACTDLGADIAVNYREEDFVAKTKEAGGADVILDMVGGDYFTRNIAAARPDGRIVQIAFLGGSKVEADLMPVMMKRLTFTGSTLRARTDEFKTALCREVEAEVWPLVASGAYRPVMDQTFALADAADAHRRMEAGEHVGKIVLQVS